MKKTNEEILLYLTILELPTFKELDIDILKKQYTKQYKKYHPSLATQDKYKDGQKYQLLTEAYRYIKENIQYVNKVIVSNALTKVEVKDNKEIVKKSITIKKEQPKVSLEKENKKDEKINLSLKNKILIASLFISLVIGIVTLSFGLQKNIEDKKVEKVEQMIEDKQYDDAKDKIEELDKDIAQQLLKKIEALKLLEEGHFTEAIEILKQLKSINDLQNITLEELLSYKGIGKTKAIELLATIELGKRINAYQKNKYYIKNTKEAYYYLKNKLSHLEQEHFMAIFLSSNNQVITDKIISIGSSTSTIANSKDVIKWAIKASSYAIIIAHNHPSGFVQPSKQDVEFTIELQSACKIVDIKFVDHIIIGKNNYFSFKNKSIFNE